MNTALVTGCGGLIGSEAVQYFCKLGFRVVGVDNDMRARLFGEAASTRPVVASLIEALPDRFHYVDMDIRDITSLSAVFAQGPFDLIIHTAAQPSHDWAAREPQTDFSINACGTLNLLEATRLHSPEAVFIFTSTNKVYGDSPNALPLVELDTRWEIQPGHVYERGIDESMSIDQSLHSLFGASKVAADVLVQEYGRYFHLLTGVFRGGCLTGPSHKGVELHGFLSYLVRAVVQGTPYRVFGYKGKQVRDNIHSYDLVNAFYHFYHAPRPGAVYNMGGSRHSHCSLVEALELVEKLAGCKANWQYVPEPRRGDHIWYVSDVSRFQKDYPEWSYTYSLEQTLEELVRAARQDVP